MEYLAGLLALSNGQENHSSPRSHDRPGEPTWPGAEAFAETSAERQAHLLCDEIAVGVVIWAAPDRIITANQAAQHLLGIDLAQMQRALAAHESSVLTNLDGTPIQREEFVAAVFRTGQAQHSTLQRNIHPDGTHRWLQKEAVPVPGEDGTIACVVVLLLDVTQHAEYARRIRASEERFRALSEHMSDMVTVLSEDWTILYASPSHRHGLGYDPDELQGRHFLDLIAPQDRHDLAIHLQACMLRPGPYPVQVYHKLHADGSIRVFEGVANNQLAEPAVHGVIINSRDITERVWAETALREQEQRFRALTEQSNDLTQVFDASAHFLYLSPSHRQILGYEPEDLLGTEALALFHPDDLPRMQATFRGCVQVSGSIVRAKCRLRHADGSWLAMDEVAHNCLDDPAIRGVVITSRDITEQVAMEQALHSQLLHDGLTGLANSAAFMETLEQAVTAAQGEQRALAVLVLDVDRFKEVNDTFGHHRGDLCLQQVGARLQRVAPESAIVSRLSGDEFAILLQAADAAQVQGAARAIQDALQEPYSLDGVTVQVDASIGGALFPTHATDALTLLRRADMAMDAAKQAHEGYALFTAAHDQYNPQRLAMLADLRHAIAAGELHLYYQPKIELQSGSVRSAEALVRWQHPVLGLVPPDQFISLAEQTGLINSLTLWVLEEAIRQCGQWMRAGRELAVSVNLSAWDLRDAALPEKIATLLARYHVPARLLCVELTESAMMGDVDRCLEALTNIFNLRVRISIDDYGTGYSSLAYLKRLPVDELKIDRSFVQHLSTDASDATIVRSTVSLAHSFGLQVVAEGVEDQAALDLLNEQHCDLAQGFFLSRPLPADQFERWLDGRAAVLV